MALLDLQGMEPETRNGGGGSHVSLTLCDSTASITVCL
jgi:hypothetical protein